MGMNIADVFKALALVGMSNEGDVTGGKSGTPKANVRKGSVAEIPQTEMVPNPGTQGPISNTIGEIYNKGGVMANILGAIDEVLGGVSSTAGKVGGALKEGGTNANTDQWAYLLGQMAAAVAPEGSWQQNLGGLAAQEGQNNIFQQFLGDLMSGEQSLESGTGLDSDLMQQGINMAFGLQDRPMDMMLKYASILGGLGLNAQDQWTYLPDLNQFMNKRTGEITDSPKDKIMELEKTVTDNRIIFSNPTTGQTVATTEIMKGLTVEQADQYLRYINGAKAFAKEAVDTQFPGVLIQREDGTIEVKFDAPDEAIDLFNDQMKAYWEQVKAGGANIPDSYPTMMKPADPSKKDDDDATGDPMPDDVETIAEQLLKRGTKRDTGGTK